MSFHKRIIIYVKGLELLSNLIVFHAIDTLSAVLLVHGNISQRCVLEYLGVYMELKLTVVRSLSVLSRQITCRKLKRLQICLKLKCGTLSPEHIVSCRFGYTVLQRYPFIATM